MYVYIYRNRDSQTIWCVRSMPKYQKKIRNYYHHKKHTLFKYSIDTFRKHFGFTIRPGKCVRTELTLEEYGDEVEV